MASAYLERMGERIRNRREELHLSRAEVARRLPGKTNENAVYRWENGKHRPNDDTLQALANVLDTSMTYFLADEAVDEATPDLMATFSGGQLDRVEAKLDAIIDHLGVKLPDELLSQLEAQLEAEADQRDAERSGNTAARRRAAGGQG